MLARDRVVTVAATATGDVGIRGVKRCASPWACMCCSPAIGERRAAELDAAFAEWKRRGGTLLFVTATIQHERADDLGELLDVIQRAWSRTWRFEAPRFGTGKNTMGMLMNGHRVRPSWYAGQARAIETTHGRAGWHPHVHAAVFVEPGADEATVTADLERLMVRWGESLARMGRTARLSLVRDKLSGELVVPGWHVRPIDDAAETARYLTKVQGGWGAGLELARMDLKRGRQGGRKPFDLLEAAMDGDTAAERLWWEYERATQGRQRIVVSPGLMARCKVEVLDDDDAAESGKLTGPAVVEAHVPARHWRALWKNGDAAALVNAVAAAGRGDPIDGTVWRWPWKWLQNSPPDPNRSP